MIASMQSVSSTENLFVFSANDALQNFSMVGYDAFPVDSPEAKKSEKSSRFYAFCRLDVKYTGLTKSAMSTQHFAILSME